MVVVIEMREPVTCQSMVASRVPRCSKRPAHRLTVDGSGDRDASATFPGAIRFVQQLPRLLPAVEGVVPGRRRPVRQHRKCLVAWTTAAPANPDLLVPLVVSQFEALPMADNGPLAANWAEPREQLQRDLRYPGSVLSSVSGSAMKRTTAGVKADRRPSCQVESRGWPSPSL